jgi:hypothetical protein
MGHGFLHQFTLIVVVRKNSLISDKIKLIEGYDHKGHALLFLLADRAPLGLDCRKKLRALAPENSKFGGLKVKLSCSIPEKALLLWNTWDSL